MSLSRDHIVTLETIAARGSVSMAAFQDAMDAAGVSHSARARNSSFQLRYNRLTASISQQASRVFGNPELVKIASAVLEYNQ